MQQEKNRIGGIRLIFKSDFNIEIDGHIDTHIDIEVV